MKMHIEIDCTPEEARRAVGLPDLTPLHERYIAMMGEAMSGGIPTEMLDAAIRNWTPMGEAGMAAWRRLFDAVRTGD